MEETEAEDEAHGQKQWWNQMSSAEQAGDQNETDSERRGKQVYSSSFPTRKSPRVPENWSVSHLFDSVMKWVEQAIEE